MTTGRYFRLTLVCSGDQCQTWLYYGSAKCLMSTGLWRDSWTPWNLALTLFGHPASTKSNPSSVSIRYALTIPIFNSQRRGDNCKTFDMEKQAGERSF